MDTQQTECASILMNYHLYVGNCCYHICEFAEKMELSGSKVEPVNQSEPSKNKTRNREKQR